MGTLLSKRDRWIISSFASIFSSLCSICGQHLKASSISMRKTTYHSHETAGEHVLHASHAFFHLDHDLLTCLGLDECTTKTRFIQLQVRNILQFLCKKNAVT